MAHTLSPTRSLGGGGAWRGVWGGRENCPNRSFSPALWLARRTDAAETQVLCTQGGTAGEGRAGAGTGPLPLSGRESCPRPHAHGRAC